MKPLLQCIIPVGSTQIDNTNLIKSILASSTNIKFIIVFDLAPETIREELIELAKGDSRLSFFSVNAGNPGAARNMGLNHMDAEWTVFFDADDLFYIDKVFREIQSINASVDAIVYNFRICFSGGDTSEVNHVLPNSFEVGANWQKIAKFPGIWRWVFRSSTLENLRFEEIKMGEDVCFLSDYLSSERRILFSELLVYEYSKQNSSQLTRSKTAMQDLVFAFEHVLVNIKEKPQINLDLRIDLASLLYYACLRKANHRERLEVIKKCAGFALKSKWNFRQSARIFLSRLKVKYG